VLDANILIRAVLGSRVLGLLRTYARHVEFISPDVAFQEAREHLPEILAVRKIPAAPAMETLDQLVRLVQTVEVEPYASFEPVARERIDRRDENDWPILAAALAFGCGVQSGRQIGWHYSWQRLWIQKRNAPGNRFRRVESLLVSLWLQCPVCKVPSACGGGDAPANTPARIAATSQRVP
jgi:predicted nucleic acid-binding protein